MLWLKQRTHRINCTLRRVPAKFLRKDHCYSKLMTSLKVMISNNDLRNLKLSGKKFQHISGNLELRNDTFNQLSDIWRNGNIQTNTKIRIYKTAVITIVKSRMLGRSSTIVQMYFISVASCRHSQIWYLSLRKDHLDI